MNQESIGYVLQYLLEKNRTSVGEICDATGINRQTLYSMLKKTSSQADICNLKKLADFFKEDISIFCGLNGYKKPEKLTAIERTALTIFRGMNHDGQERVLEYMNDIGDKPKYKK